MSSTDINKKKLSILISKSLQGLGKKYLSIFHLIVWRDIAKKPSNNISPKKDHTVVNQN